MRYERFVELRSDAWTAFAEDLRRTARNRAPSYDQLQDLSRRYRRILHDHAIASSRFPGTAAASRVAALSLAGTRLLTRSVDTEPAWRRLARFWSSTFPATFQRHLPLVSVAGALLVLAALIGASVAAVNPGVGVLLLGSESIDGLRRGELWTESVFRTVPAGVITSGIATNNLSVALTSWAGGALGGLGSLWILIFNGALLGAVVVVTAHYSVASGLLEFIAAHGPLEISTIVVASGAGLVLGRGLILAEDRPRSEIVQRHARESLVLLGGTLPWLVPLAVIESYVSPSPEIPVALKATLGGLMLAAYLATALRRPRIAAGMEVTS